MPDSSPTIGIAVGVAGEAADAALVVLRLAGDVADRNE
jgi:hypothetical protein